METATDNHKYPYGETPREVIRDAWVAFDGHNGNDFQRFIHWSAADDLLTVLDALWARSADCDACEGHGAFVHMGRRGLTKNPCNDCFAPRQLRIDILAALGIEEG